MGAALYFSAGGHRKGAIMVALAVPVFGATIPLCLHRQQLKLAHDAYDRGELIACGCHLREAIDRYLSALVKLYNVKPPEKKRVRFNLATPSGKLKALSAAKVFEDDCCIAETIDCCNRLAHCEKVRDGDLEWALEFAYSLFDDPRLTRGGVEGGAV